MFVRADYDRVHGPNAGDGKRTTGPVNHLAAHSQCIVLDRCSHEYNQTVLA